MPNNYDLGDSVRLQSTFTVTGTVADPDIVELELRDPSGNTSSFTFAGGDVSRQSTGIYFRDEFLDEAGQWWYRYFGSGTVTAAGEAYLIVDRPVV